MAIESSVGFQETAPNTSTATRGGNLERGRSLGRTLRRGLGTMGTAVGNWFGVTQDPSESNPLWQEENRLEVREGEIGGSEEGEGVGLLQGDGREGGREDVGQCMGYDCNICGVCVRMWCVCVCARVWCVCLCTCGVCVCVCAHVVCVCVSGCVLLVCVWWVGEKIFSVYLTSHIWY